MDAYHRTYPPSKNQNCINGKGCIFLKDSSINKTFQFLKQQLTAFRLPFPFPFALETELLLRMIPWDVSRLAASYPSSESEPKVLPGQYKSLLKVSVVTSVSASSWLQGPLTY